MSSSNPTLVLPQHRDLYYGGAWHRPQGGYLDTFNPATGESLGPAAEANSADVDAAVRAAQKGFAIWRGIKPLERAGLLKKVAQVLRDNAFELALLDAANCGNPICEMQRDALIAAAQIDYYAGLATEVKGETLPMGEGILNYTLREPYGVCARIVAYNHPIMFTAAKMAPPLIAGNAVIMKPPYQAPLSSYRMMELIDGILPPGVLNILSGGVECGQALVNHPDVPRLALIGSVPTGRAIARAGAERLKHVTLELGGKNACIIYPDADMDKAIPAAVNGMNFTWCAKAVVPLRVCLCMKASTTKCWRACSKRSAITNPASPPTWPPPWAASCLSSSTKKSCPTSPLGNKRVPPWLMVASGPAIRHWPRVGLSSPRCSPT